MYTVSKNPSKIITKMRRSLVQNDAPFDSCKDMQQRNLFVIRTTRILKTPKPVFRNIKKEQHQVQQRAATESSLDIIESTTEHDKLIKFIDDSWKEIIALEYNETITNAKCFDSKNNDLNIKMASGVLNDSQPKCIRYKSSECEKIELKNFKPFDLESFWIQRLLDDVMKDS